VGKEEGYSILTVLLGNSIVDVDMMSSLTPVNDKRHEREMNKKKSHKPIAGKELRASKADRPLPAVKHPNNADYLSGLADAPKKGERIVSAMAEYISTMNFGDGDKLPAEKDLCEVLGVGRRSLREALIAMQTLGLLQARHGTGWYVRKFDPVNCLGFLSVLLRDFTEKDLFKIMEVRCIIEPKAARLATANITKEGIEKLAQTVESLRECAAVNDHTKWRRYDKQFHDCLIRECGNAILIMLYLILDGLLQSFYWLTPENNLQNLLCMHENIFEKVKAGDADGADELVRKHLESSIENIQKHHPKGIKKLPLV
jgi:GntR family transcriptional regulator, transcriptional repressor for pyruvate dehydrogenase complex